MIFKIHIEATTPNDRTEHECRVVAVENGQQLEKRIDSIISNLKADGYQRAVVVDCYNLEYPDREQHR